MELEAPCAGGEGAHYHRSKQTHYWGVRNFRLVDKHVFHVLCTRKSCFSTGTYIRWTTNQ